MESRTEHILVVDDYSAHRNAVAFGLTKAGFRVSAAASATKAMMLAEHEDFDLVITDYYMPDFTGSDLVKKLRENDKYVSIPIILLTGRTNELNVRQLRDDLSVLVVSKPCPTKHLAELVSKCLEMARSAS